MGSFFIICWVSVFFRNIIFGFTVCQYNCLVGFLSALSMHLYAPRAFAKVILLIYVCRKTPDIIVPTIPFQTQDQTSEILPLSTLNCPGNLTSEMHIESLSDTASESSLHYFAHIVKVKFVLIHLLTVLTKHACQHNSFWGSRCVSSHAPTISLKPVLFTAISAHIFRPSEPVFSEHTSSLVSDLPK